MMNRQMSEENSCLMAHCLYFEVEIPLALMKSGVSLVVEKLAAPQVKWVEEVLESLEIVGLENAGKVLKLVEQMMVVADSLMEQ